MVKRTACTPAPNADAPSQSMRPPRITAHRSEIAPEPTLVPQLFAASFAPMPKLISAMVAIARPASHLS